MAAPGTGLGRAPPRCPQCSVHPPGQAVLREGGFWGDGEEAGEHETDPRGLKPTLLLFHESFSMAARSSGFRIDELGSAPAALMSSSTAASHEKVRRAEGTWGGATSLKSPSSLGDGARLSTLRPSCWSRGHARPGGSLPVTAAATACSRGLGHRAPGGTPASSQGVPHPPSAMVLPSRELRVDRWEAGTDMSFGGTLHEQGKVGLEPRTPAPCSYSAQ